MRKIKLLLFTLLVLIIPVFVYAKNDIEITSIELENKSDEVEELSEPIIENNKSTLDVRMYDIDDYIEYKIKLKNTSDKNYYINDKNLNLDSLYTNYKILYKDNSDVIKPGKEKEIILKIQYNNKVDSDEFLSGRYTINKILSINIADEKIVNPKTVANFFIVFIVIGASILFIKKKKRISKYLLVLLIVPLTVHAINYSNVEIIANITIKKVKPNPCTYNGELEQGAEYVNGQYTYRYMQEMSYDETWKEMEAEGWGVILTDKESTEDVTTKLCTTINDKPVVSMANMFKNSATSNIDLDSFDTSTVINMANMFNGCANIDKLNLRNFDTAKVTSMGAMFNNATSLEEVNLDGFDLTSSPNGSNIISVMFNGASNIKSVSMKSWKIPESFTNAVGCRTSQLCSESLDYVDVTDWVLSNTTNITGLFGNCKTKEIKGLETWDTSNIENMSDMFDGIINITKVDLSSWDTSKVTTMAAMFSGATSLEEVNLDGFDLTAGTSSSMLGGMFGGASNIKSISMKNWKLPETFTNAIGCRTSSLCAANLDYIDVTGWDLSNTTNIYGLFGNLNAKEIRNINTWKNTSNITDIGYMFYGNTNLESIDLSSFNTSKVTSMNSMFSEAASLEEVNLDGFDLTSVTSSNIINSMFNGASNIKKISMKNWKIPSTFTSAIGCRTSSLCSENIEYIDVTGWDLSNTTNIYGLFADSKTKEIRGLKTWKNTSNLTNIGQMFYSNININSLDLSNFDTSNVTDMSLMFYNASKLEKIDLSSFNTSKVTSMESMFNGATSLEEVNLDGFDLTSGTSSSIINSMFSGASNLKKVSMKNWKIPSTFTNAIGCRTSSLCSENIEYIDVTGWDLSNTTNIYGLFADSKTKEIRGLKTWKNTSNLTNIAQMFYNDININSLDLSNFDTSNVTDMSSMFYNASKLKKIDLSSFNTSKVTSMGSMFNGATSLEEVNLDGFDLTSGTSSSIINAMFNGASNLKKVSMKNWKLPESFQSVVGCRTSCLCSENIEYIDVTGWDLSNTTSINGLFADSTAGEIKGLNTWNTSNVTNMGNMFESINATTLDLSSWNTSNVTNMKSMFIGSTKLKTIKVSNNFKVSQVTSYDYMFKECPSLIGGNGTAFDSNHIDKEYARIDTATTPGYFTRAS